jgi:uncharacterized repeat protein (TIGR02543 family)
MALRPAHTCGYSSLSARFFGLLAVPLPLLGVINAAYAVTYYVDTAGRGGTPSDTNPGTISQPFKTIEKARDTIRAIGAKGVTVYIRGGTYSLTQALQFGARDSGIAGAPNVYRNYPSEHPIISGGQAITQTWTVYSGNIWRCNVGGLRFNSLFVDGVRATRAREPDGTYYITQTPGGYTNQFTFSGSDINPNWTRLTDVEIVYLHEYTSPRERISSVAGQTCYLEGNCAYTIWQTNRYWVENVFEGLDTAGEWYLNKGDGYLYYYPVGGKNPNTSEIVAPVVGGQAVWFTGGLLDVQGTSSNYVEYLEFRGLTFSHSDWYLPTGGNEGWSEFLEQCNTTHASPNWYGQGPGVMLRGVRYCVFSDNTVSHIGGDGVRVYGNYVTFTNNAITDIGATGYKQGIPSLSDPGAAASTSNNTVTDNTVYNCGVVFPFGMGILAMIGGHNNISHNLVYNIPFMGINTGRAQGYGGDNTYNTVTYNEVHHVMTMVGDSGAIYFAGTQTGTVAHHNKVHDCPSLYSAIFQHREQSGHAFYIDEGASGITISNNWIYRVAAGLQMNSSADDIFTNNVIVSPEYIVFMGCNPGTTATKNIIYNTGTTIEDIYRYVTNWPYNSNYNDLYNTNSSKQSTWDSWITQAHTYNLDLNSITSDPLFVNPGADNYSLQSSSPMLGLGFAQIDMGTVGPRTNSYTITASAGTGGSITPSGAVSVVSGASQTFTIQASNGYSISSVQVDGASVGAVSQYTFTNVVANHTISATFTATATYTLTTSATNGSVTKMPNQTSYTSGQSVSLQATANTGYGFTGWSGDLTGTANPATLVMNSNKSVTANFAANLYTLTINATNGSVTKTPDAASYSYGQVVTLQAVPNPGYSFSGWSGDASGTSTTTTVTMTANRSVTANFTANTYILAVNAVNGSVTKTPNKTSYAYGDVVTLQAVPNAGYSFSSWSGDASGTANPTTITMNANKSVTASFTAAAYILTVNAVNGSVTKTPNKTSYAYGDVVTLQAVPNAGYSFSGWSGDVSGSANPTTITMNANKSVTASFTAGIYTLTVNAVNGSVTTTPSKTSYAYGDVVTLEAVPNAGYSFSGWSGDASGTANPTTITMNANKSVTASFTAATYTLTVSAVNGSVTATPSKTAYAYGDVVDLQAVPNADYSFSGWSGDVSGTANPTKLTMNANKSVTASFKKVVDQQPPVVDNCAPAPGSIQAPSNTLVSLHLRDEGAGVDAASVSLQVNGNLVYAGDVNSYPSSSGVCFRSGTQADYTYTYQPQTTYGYGRTVSVLVHASDLAGNAMPGQTYSLSGQTYSLPGETYSFATEMYAFGTSRSICADQTRVNQGKPVTVSDDRGNLWVVWQAGGAGRRQIYAARYVPDVDTYNSTVPVSGSTGDHCNPAVAIDGAGTLYVVWQENAGGAWDIYASTSVDGSTWSTPKRVSDATTGPANPPVNRINPVVAASRQSPGLVAVAWQDDRSGNQDIYVSQSTNQFQTLTISRVTSDMADQVNPVVAVDSQDAVVVLWTDARNGKTKTQIYGAASDNGPWTNVAVVTAGGKQSSPRVASGSAGRVLHLAWVDDAAGSPDVFYARMDGLPTSPLTGVDIVDDTSGAAQQAPAITAVGADGNDKVFLCWEDGRNLAYSGTTDLYFAEVSPGAIRTNILVDSGGTAGNQHEAALGIDREGYPYVVWADDRNKVVQNYYAGATHADSVPVAETVISASTGGTVGTPPDQITSLDDVSVMIPAQACSFDATICIARIWNPQGFAAESLRQYDFGPSGLTFAQPVTVTIPYESVGKKIRAYWFDAVTGTFSDQGVTDVQDIAIGGSSLRALQFKTTHFTAFYLVLADAPSPGAAGGGCSLAPVKTSDPVGYCVPFLLLAGIMFTLWRRDRRHRQT